MLYDKQMTSLKDKIIEEARKAAKALKSKSKGRKEESKKSNKKKK